MEGKCSHQAIGHPILFDPANYNLANQNKINLFGTSPYDQWTAIQKTADSYLQEASFSYPGGLYRIFYPFLQPFPHGKGYYSMHVGEESSIAAHARLPLPAGVTLPNEYLIEFEYYYENAGEQSQFQVFGAWDGKEYDDILLHQTGDALSTHDQSDVAPLSAGTWHHFAIFVRADETYDFYLDGSSLTSGPQNGTGPLEAIGYIGDVSGANHNGQGFFDNFRISAGPVILFADLLNEQNISAWTVFGRVQLDSDHLSHDEHGLTDYPYWSSISGEIANRISRVSFAYRVTQDPRYADWVRPVLQSLCDTGWQGWGDPDYCQSEDGQAKVALDGAYFTRGFALALDNIATALTPTEISHYEQCLLKRGVTQLDVNSCYGPDAENNGVALQASAMGIAALSLSCNQDHTVVASYLRKARDKLNLQYDSCGDRDGGWVEGMGYGSLVSIAGFFHYLDWKVLGTDAFQHPYLQNIGRFVHHMLVPDHSALVNFADSGSTPQMYGTFLPMLYRAQQDPYALTLINTVGWHVDMPFNLELLEPLPTFELPDLSKEIPGRDFRGIGWGTLRTSWQTDALFVAFHSGPEVMHTHLDQNNFVIFKKGQWLARDPGYQIYQEGMGHEFTYGSVGHNVLRINDKDQIKRAGTLKHFFASADGGGYVRGEAASAYGSDLSSYERLVALFSDPQCVLVADDFRVGTNEVSIEFLLHPQRQRVETIDQSSQSFTLKHDEDSYSRLQFFAPVSLNLSSETEAFGIPGGANLYLNLNVLDREYTLEMEYIAPTGGTVQQYDGTRYHNIGSLNTAMEWQTGTFTCRNSYFDYSTNPGTNVLFQFSNGVFIHKITAYDTTGSNQILIDDVVAGEEGDNAVASHTPGVCFYPGEWGPAEMFAERMTRSTSPASTLRAVADKLFPASNPGFIAAMLCTADTWTDLTNMAWRSYQAGTELGLVATINGVPRRVLNLQTCSPGVGLEDMLVDTFCDAGVSGDQGFSTHTPGINLHAAEWNDPTQVDGLTVRVAQAVGANFFVNMQTGAQNVWKVGLLYRAQSDGFVGQYFGPSDGYRNVASLVGDDTWRIAFLYARPPFYDYVPGTLETQVLCNFSVPITIADLWAQGPSALDFCDVGAAGDDNTDEHTPGISIYPAEWGDPAVTSGFTSRHGLAGGNFYLNLEDLDRFYELEITYLAPTDVSLHQCLGTTSADYRLVEVLPGDGTVRRVRVAVDRDYVDYPGMGGNQATNVLFQFNAEIDLIDVVARGME